MERCVSKTIGVAVLALLPMLGGCWGVWTPRGTPGRPQHRVEVEYVPEAVLVREDTTPRWPLGRHAFQRGADRLVVVTRITAFPDSDKKNATVRDQHFERMWIMVPLNTPLGQELRVEDLEKDFLTGYDVSRRGDPFYIQPCRALGTITLLEERPGAVLARLDVVVEPKQLPTWRVTETLALPVAPTGLHAGPPTGTRFAEVARSRVTVAPAPPRSVPVPPKTASAPPPGAATAPATQAADQPPAAARSIEGAWKGDTGAIELRFQFFFDGTFAYSSCRSEYQPGVMSGTYYVGGDFVIMNIERWHFGGLDHMHHLEDDTTLRLLVKWSGNTLVLSGNFRSHLKQGEVRLHRASFADMRRVSPPSRPAPRKSQ